MASITLSASFAQQSSGNSAGGGGTGSPAGLKADSVHSSQQGTQTSQQGTQNPHGTPTQNAISTQGGSSSTSAPSTAGPAPNRTGSSEASQDGLRPAAPGIPSFLPASAFAPASQGPRRVQFYCPSGHLLEEWSTSAGEQRRCPHCGGVATVPSG